jgi:hypothetical protein
MIVPCPECGGPRGEHDWCPRCLGLPARARAVAKPSPAEPRDWMVVEAKVPGVPSGPVTFKEAVTVAKAFGGRVLPWAARPQKALGDYPHPGGMKEGGKA